MKKNSEYVGVDEKFVPEDEKYVKDSILGNREETKNKIKKGLKIGLGVYAIWFLLAMVFLVVVVALIFNHSRKMNEQILETYDKANEQIFELYDNVVENMNDETQNDEDTIKQNDKSEDIMNNMTDMMNQFMNNQ